MFKGIFGPVISKTATDITEAAVRNVLGNTSRVLYLDEFEDSKHREPILKLLRSSTTGDNIIRSNPSQGITETSLSHIVWLSAKELGIVEAADVNRFIQFELMPLEIGRASTLVIPPNDELRDLGHRLMVAAIRHWKTATEFALKIKQVPFGGLDRRLAEIYAVPIGNDFRHSWGDPQ